MVPGMDDPDPLISWGSAELVAAEELVRGRGYWWDPEGGRLAVCRVDTAPVEEWWIASPEKPTDPPRSIRYPAVGTANADVQRWVVDVASGPQIEVDWNRGEFEYLAEFTSVLVFLVAILVRSGVGAAEFNQLGVLFLAEQLANRCVHFFERFFELSFFLFLGEFLVGVDCLCDFLPFFMDRPELGGLFVGEV